MGQVALELFAVVILLVCINWNINRIARALESSLHKTEEE